MNAEVISEYKRTRREFPDYPASWALHYAKQWGQVLELERSEKFTIELSAEHDDLPIKGNAMASGDDEADREAEAWITNQLRHGNVWAWACVEVKVTHNESQESATAYLGACSYKSKQDFKKGGYYLDMINECIDQISARLEKKLSEAF